MDTSSYQQQQITSHMASTFYPQALNSNAKHQMDWEVKPNHRSIL